VSVACNAAGGNLSWRAVERARYRIEYSTALETNGWIELGLITATNSLQTMTDPSATNSSRRFYRVLQLVP
jgi:hypothetical protein